MRARSPLPLLLPIVVLTGCQAGPGDTGAENAGGPTSTEAAQDGGPADTEGGEDGLVRDAHRLQSDDACGDDANCSRSVLGALVDELDLECAEPSLGDSWMYVFNDNAGTASVEYAECRKPMVMMEAPVDEDPDGFEWSIDEESSRSFYHPDIEGALSHGSPGTVTMVTGETEGHPWRATGESSLVEELADLPDVESVQIEP